MVCDLLRASLASCEQLAGNGVVSGLQIFHAPGLAWWGLHSSHPLLPSSHAGCQTLHNRHMSRANRSLSAICNMCRLRACQPDRKTHAAQTCRRKTTAHDMASAGASRAASSGAAPSSLQSDKLMYWQYCYIPQIAFQPEAKV